MAKTKLQLNSGVKTKNSAKITQLVKTQKELIDKQNKQAKLLEAVVKHLDGQLSPIVNKLNKTVSVVWDNQVGISKSQHNTDDQLAVLTRIVIVAVNTLVKSVQRLEYHGIKHDWLPNMSVGNSINVTHIGELFKTWEKFKERSDYQEFFQDWCMGCDIETLPPPVTKKPDLRVVDNPSEIGEENEDDIRESETRDGISQVEDDQEVKEAQMPEVLHLDNNENQPPDGEDV